MSKPRFVVVPRGRNSSKEDGTFTLIEDMWDDFHFKTSYVLTYTSGGTQREIGYVKIASRGMKERDPHTVLPNSFSGLSSDFFSLGQDREYYEAISQLPDNLRSEVLAGLRDVAADAALFREVGQEPVMLASLLRSVPRRTVETQFRRIIAGDEPLTAYRFSFYREPNSQGAPGFRIDFGVHPGVKPATNVQVLIGSNGVGKTQLLRDFLAAASGMGTREKGIFRDEMAGPNDDALRLPFANVVYVSFSAFDALANLPAAPQRVQTHVVGLSSPGGGSLEDQFLQSIKLCAKGPRASRWLSAIRTLASADSLLDDQALTGLIGAKGQVLETEARVRFSKLSSGHKIVVLTVSRLVELVEERTLVLMDEPETHLHPPLLSALTRAVSDLVMGRNGVAIVATHSPVVLQEVPRMCARVLRRSGDDLRVWQLETESFGESVSRLTAEVFHLDVRKTGYHKLLRDLLHEHGGSIDAVLEDLDTQLGSEGRFVLHALSKQHW